MDINKKNIANVFIEKIVKSDNKLYYAILFIIILTSIVLRIKLYLLNQSFWFDEALLGLNIKNSYLSFFSLLDNNQMCPPLFLVISKFLLNLSGHENNIYYRDLILRLFPCICSILSVIIFPFLTAKINENKYFNIAANFLFSFNALLISYTHMFKQYETEVLFSIILLIIFLSFDLKSTSIKKTIFYSIIIFLSPWFSLSSLFVIGSGCIAVGIQMIKDRFNSLKKALIIYIPFLYSLTLYYVIYYLETKSIVGGMQGIWLNEFLNINNFVDVFSENICRLFSLKNLCKDIPVPFETLRLGIIPILAVTSVIFIKNNNYKKNTMLFIPIIISIIFSFLKLYPFYQRFILFIIPNLVLIMLIPFIFIKKNKYITCFMAITIIITIIFQFKYPLKQRIYKLSDSRELFKILKMYNPKLQNMFIINKEYYYYANIKKKNTNAIMSCETYSMPEFKNLVTNKINNKLLKIQPNVTYWIYAGNSLYIEKNEFIKEFMKNKNEIKIKNIIFLDNRECEYILSFEKKGN